MLGRLRSSLRFTRCNTPVAPSGEAPGAVEYEVLKDHIKHQFTEGQVAKARWFFSGSIKLTQYFSGKDLANATKLPEVCMVGRSNVGKSSLINSLLKEKATQVSKTPGRTQSITVLELRNAINVVDLPGYGYAQVGKEAKKKLHKLILDYIKGPTDIKLICLLFDCRRGVQEGDIDLMNSLDDSRRPYLIILTKADKVGSRELDDRVRDLEEIVRRHPMCYPEILATSSLHSYGLDRLKSMIVSACVGNEAAN
eukprot:TRINITY_DN14689_c0_g1_i1.p1 TRINITY_DN14689_c0_g1~~TRINITY_DN14689_c0_g1_i1.p1  ORF type:complete len:253 (-),score=48.18 TRINITY_DN14689_c0_g1_i1:59-817(-)